MIHRIRIQNFKSLRDVTVNLSPVTVLVGKSGAGKSNFVDAVRFFRDLITHEGGRHPDAQSWPMLKCATNPTQAMAFEVDFTVPGFENHFAYKLRLHPENLQLPPSLEELQYGDRVLFRQEARTVEQPGGFGGGGEQPAWSVEPDLVTVPPPGPLAIRRLPGIEEVVMAFTAITTGIGIYSFPYDVLKTPAQQNGLSGLGEQGENYLTVLKEISSNLQDVSSRKGIVAALRQVNSTVVSVELDSIQQPTTAIVGHRLGKKTLPLQLLQESDGFRRFYAHLLALYQTPPKQMLIFEEPENGIYIGALSLLAEEFKAAPESGRGQVILTTHSPALLDHFSAEEIRVVQLVDLETQIGPVSTEQKDALADELLHSGELLTVDPARMEAMAE